MLFNNLISQSGGGTYTAVSVNVSPGGSKSFEIPDGATMLCFAGWCNGNCGYIAARTDGETFQTVQKKMASRSALKIAGDLVTIESTYETSVSYGSITGTLIYK